MVDINTGHQDFALEHWFPWIQSCTNLLKSETFCRCLDFPTFFVLLLYRLYLSLSSFGILKNIYISVVVTTAEPSLSYRPAGFLSDNGYYRVHSAGLSAMWFKPETHFHLQGCFGGKIEALSFRCLGDHFKEAFWHSIVCNICCTIIKLSFFLT